MFDEMSLEEISELLDVKDENSLIRKKIEEYEEELERLTEKSIQLESEVKKKEQEWESIKGSDNLADIIIVSKQYERLMREHTAVLDEVMMVYRKIENLRNKLNG